MAKASVFWFLVVAVCVGCAQTSELYCVTGPKVGGPGVVQRCFETAAERDARHAELELSRRQSIEDRARAERGARQARQQELESEESARAAERQVKERQHAERREADAREQAEREAREARARARLDDPAYAGPALSALMCEREADLRELGADASRVAAEERAAGPGAVDASARAEIGEERLAYGQELAAYRKALARLQSTAPSLISRSCASSAPQLACFLRGECASDAARDVADVMRYAPAHFGVGLR